MSTPIAEHGAGHQLRHLLAGALSGLFSCCIVHPLDVIRTRMQTHHGHGHAYSGVWDGLRSIRASEGWRALYRGLTPALVGSGISWGLFMWWYSIAKDRNSVSGHGSGAFNHLISAAEAGIVTSLITNPIWLCKTRLEVQGQPIEIMSKTVTVRPYLGMTDCLKRIIVEEGFTSLYRGLVPSLLLCSHGAIQFASYEFLKARFLNTSDGIAVSAHSSLQVFILAGMSKIVATTSTFPLSTIRARLHQQPESLLGITYRGLVDTTRQIIRNEGWRGFYKGLTPSLLRVTPHSALMLLLYEQLYITLAKQI